MNAPTEMEINRAKQFLHGFVLHKEERVMYLQKLCQTDAAERKDLTNQLYTLQEAQNALQVMTALDAMYNKILEHLNQLVNQK